MPPNLLSRQVFNFWLNPRKSIWFYSWKVLQKYRLEEHLLSYLATSLFPTKGTWKTIVEHKIRIYYETAWIERVDNDADFARFRLIHPSIKMSNIWTIRHNKSSFYSALIVARLCTLVPQQNDPIQCLFCGTTPSDIYKHTVSACPRFTNERESFIRLVSNEVCTDIGNFLRSANMESFLCALLKAKGHTCFNNNETTYGTFLYNSIEFVSQTIRIDMKYGKPSIAFRRWCGCQMHGSARTADWNYTEYK